MNHRLTIRILTAVGTVLCWVTTLAKLGVIFTDVYRPEKLHLILLLCAAAVVFALVAYADYLEPTRKRYAVTQPRRTKVSLRGLHIWIAGAWISLIITMLAFAK